MKLIHNQRIAKIVSAFMFLLFSILLLITQAALFSKNYQQLSDSWNRNSELLSQQIISLLISQPKVSVSHLQSTFNSATMSPYVTMIGLVDDQNILGLLRKGESELLYENHFTQFSAVQSGFVANRKVNQKSLISNTGKQTFYAALTETANDNRVLVIEFDYKTQYQALLSDTLTRALILLAVTLIATITLHFAIDRIIGRPLRFITLNTSRALQRNFTDSAPTIYSRELNQLTESINSVQSQVKRTIDGLEHNQTIYRVFTEALPQACAMVKMDGAIVSRFGPPDSLFFSNKTSDRIMDFVPNNFDLNLISLIRDCHGEDKTLRQELNIGTETVPIHYDFSFTPVTEPIVGEPVTLVTAINVSDRKKHEQTLSLLASVFESREAIAITDPDRRIIRVNHEFCRITGFEESDLIMGSMELFASDRHASNFWDMIWHKVSDEGSWGGELSIKKKTGDTIPIRQTVSVVRDDKDRVQNFVIVFSDISEQKKAMAMVRYHANFDTLTDLPNRRLFMHQLTRAMSQASRHNYFSALIFIDLDNFKQINDSYGHPTGDQVLIQVAKRIKERIRKEDFLARLSGDEFVILLNQLGENEADSAQRAQSIATNIMKEIRLPVQVEQQSFLTSASLGITLFSETQNTAFDIMREADTAMYQAKTKGKNYISFFSKDMQATVKRALNLANRISMAINEREFKVFYQPQYNEFSQLIGLEALVRWNPESKDSLSPADFIPVAEESGKIVELGDYILFDALKNLKQMIDLGLPDTFKRLAVNISPRQFMEHNFEQRITQAIQQSQVPPSMVELEITEGSLMDNNEHAMSLLERLKTMGFSIAIDDFGTGYSSLAYLKSLPIDKLKIDQYFVRDIAHNASDAQIVETIISMAQAMGLQVIAEGVETREQLDFLRKNNCMEYQGYYFSRPLSFDDLVKRVLTTNNNTSDQNTLV